MKQRIIKVAKWLVGISFGIFLLVSILIYCYQDKICNFVLQEAGKTLEKPVFYSKVDLTFWQTFPNLSVNVYDAKIQDAYSHTRSNKTLLAAERISITLNPLDLWRENYHVQVFEISKGQINIRTHADGDVNYLIFKPKESTEKSKYNFKISSFHVSQMQINYLDKAANQFYWTQFNDMEFSGDFDQDKFELLAEGDLDIRKIQSGQVSLIKNKPVSMALKMEVNNVEGSFTLPESKIAISKLPFIAKGKYTSDSLLIQVKSNQLKLSDLANQLADQGAEKELNLYKGSGDVDFDLKLFGSNQKNQNLNISCDFAIRNGFLTEPTKKIRVKNIGLNGKYLANGNPNQDKLNLTKLKFNTAAGPFQGNLLIEDFVNPKLSGKAKGAIDLSAANAILKLEEVEKMDGKIKLNSIFNVEIRKNLIVHRCDGDVSLKNVWLKLKGDQRTFENINGNIALKKNDVKVKEATLKVNDSDLKLNGSFENVFEYLAQKGTLKVNAEICSNHINIEDLGTTTKNEKIQSAAKAYSLPNDILGNIQLSTKSIHFNKHVFENVSGRVNVSQRKLSFPNLTLRNANADIVGSLQIEETAPERMEIHANLRSQNIHFGPLFREWNNFEQDVITENQISGRVETEVDFFAPFNLVGGIELKDIDAKVHMKIFDGHLKNVSSFEDIVESLRTNTGKLLIGKKNIDAFQSKLNDIHFKTLENNLIIRNGQIEIPNMHVESSAMNMDVSGKHTFENQIDYHFKFYFRDLLGEDKDAAFGKIIDDATGLKIFLRMYGDLDDPSIEWDKSSRKQQMQEDWVEEKKTVKSILKTEFGAFKNDTSVQAYKPKEKPKEVIKVNFNAPEKKTNIQSDASSVPKSNGSGKMKSTLNQWKQQQNQANVTVTVKKG